MEDEIVSLETAMLLRKKGFNEPCCRFYEDNELYKLAYYHGDGAGFVRNNSPINDMMYCEEMQCTAPTQSLAQKWLREHPECHMFVIPSLQERNIIYYVHIIRYSNKTYLGHNLMLKDSNANTMTFTSYEEAIEESLKYCLKSMNYRNRKQLNNYKHTKNQSNENR